jgi:hypothetical protein
MMRELIFSLSQVVTEHAEFCAAFGIYVINCTPGQLGTHSTLFLLVSNSLYKARYAGMLSSLLLDRPNKWYSDDVLV